MKVWALTKEDVLHELKTTEQGLTGEEARKRLLDLGENVLPEKKKILLFKFIYYLGNWFAILLWIAGGLSILASRFTNDESMAGLP